MKSDLIKYIRLKWCFQYLQKHDGLKVHKSRDNGAEINNNDGRTDLGNTKAPINLEG